MQRSLYLQSRESVISASKRNFIEKAWNSYGKRLYWFALTLVCSEADAEDVMQNVFLGLLRTGQDERDLSHLRAYLYRAVRNEAVGLIKRREGGHTVPLEVSTLLVGASQDNAARSLDVSRALATLPFAQREVLVLKLYHGMTFDEIAGLAGLSINTVASRYRYALEKMRKALGRKAGS